MIKNSAIFDLFSSFIKGMQAYFAMPELPKEMKAKKESTSYRIASSIAPCLPEGVHIDIGVKGADILIWNDEKLLLALFWSPSYIERKKRLNAIAFHEKEKPLLTLALSLFPEREKFLLYRIEEEYIEYLHIAKSTGDEEVLKRCTIAEGKKDDGQLFLPLRRKRSTSSKDR